MLSLHSFFHNCNFRLYEVGFRQNQSSDVSGLTIKWEHLSENHCAMFLHIFLVKRFSNLNDHKIRIICGINNIYRPY